MTSLEPIADFVVIKKADSEVIVGGVLLPEVVNQQIIRGEVIAVGPGRWLESGVRGGMQCRVGDIVLVNSFRCVPQVLPLEMDGEFMLVPESDIAAIVR
jgi:chaperonin GroES